MATLPPAPGPFYITTIFELSVIGNSNPRGDGGSSIVQYQVGYGTNPDGPEAYNSLIGLDGAGTISPLASKVTYYFWARVRTAVGWSGWSARTSATTKGVPDPPGAPYFSNVKQTALDVTFNLSGDTGGDPITYTKLGYGTSSSSPTTEVTQAVSDRIFDLTGLTPGGTYYFWGKALNLHGESGWSWRSTGILVAGAKVKVGLVWKRAVPYVRVGGVWVLASPWVRSAGFWNEIEE